MECHKEKRWRSDSWATWEGHRRPKRIIRMESENLLKNAWINLSHLSDLAGFSNIGSSLQLKEMHRNASEFHSSKEAWKLCAARCFIRTWNFGIHRWGLLIPPTNLLTNRGTHQDQAWSRCSRWMGTSPPSPEGSDCPLEWETYEPVNLRRFIEIHSVFSW